MITFSELFPIFFLTLGPVKTIPVFYQLTKHSTPKIRRQISISSTIIALITCLLIAFIGRFILNKWRVSLEALQLAGGLLLLISAIKVVNFESQPKVTKIIQADTPVKEIMALTLSPLVTPIIITPYGVVAILFYMLMVQGDIAAQRLVLGMIVLMMICNYLGMAVASKIMNFIGLSPLFMMSWILGIMQAALAIDMMLVAFTKLGLIHRLSG